MTNETQYEAGIETNSDIESGIEESHDSYYYVDDGEFAFVVGASVVNDLAESEGVDVEEGKDLLHVDRYVCEAGLVDKVGATNTHTCREGQIASFLSDYVENEGSHEEAIEISRSHFK